MLLDDTDYPKDWPIMHLDRVAKRGSGHTPSKSHPEYWNGNIKWVSLADSYRLDGGYISDTDKKISPEGIKNSSAVIHPPETVILSRDAGVGKSAVTKEAMAVSQHFIAWNCNQTGKVAPWFLYYTLQFHQKELERQAVGSTIKTIGLPFFKNLEIALPPFPEQKKIAAILSTWDRAIEGTEKLLANSQQQKKALMQHLLTGKKRLPGFTGEWKNVLLKDIALIKKGQALSSKDLMRGDYPVIAGGKTSPYKHKNFTHENVITVSASGAYAGYVSFHSYKIWASDCSVITSRSGNSISFIYFWLSYLQNKIFSLQSGGAQPHIYPRDLELLHIHCPPLPEQKAIAAVLSTADEELAAIEADLARLRQEKKALMQQLLTGKRRVRVD
ncbi:hypothetical protein AD951_02890 [Acetobacter malorum]|uniref:Type I restriction modification DNA specificity domain-containing protein n=1 Tax=Acetobacter malorum TaxID=178901 RepID=A0A149URH5_9PROT|nr:restriction endonuclease subunit S [Acetobacter malorum]KXV70444.1 hypothetical protein AD951_02890 [Acetobacter malorum]